MRVPLWIVFFWAAAAAHAQAPVVELSTASSHATQQLEHGYRLLNIVPPPGFVPLPPAYVDFNELIQIYTLSPIPPLASFVTEDDVRRLAVGDEVEFDRLAVILPAKPDGEAIRTDVEDFRLLARQVETRFTLEFDRIRQATIEAHAEVHEALESDGISYPELVDAVPLGVYVQEPWVIAFGQRNYLELVEPEQAPIKFSNISASALINLQERPLNIRMLVQYAQDEDEGWLRETFVTWLQALHDANPDAVRSARVPSRVQNVSLDDRQKAERVVYAAAAVMVIGLVMAVFQILRSRKRSDRELQFERDQAAKERSPKQ